MVRTFGIAVILVSFCSCIPLKVHGASIISNGVRNFIVEESTAKTTESVLSTEGQSNNQEALIDTASSAAGAAATIGTATAGAAMAGAGSLAGYAGMASAVSSLGLGGITSTVGSLIAGHSVAGAAATAVCTAAVGGPVAMGAIVVGGLGATAYGLSKGVSYLQDTETGKWVTDKTNGAWQWLKSKWD